jgi:hypothetical protein
MPIEKMPLVILFTWQLHGKQVFSLGWMHGLLLESPFGYMENRNKLNNP